MLLYAQAWSDYPELPVWQSLIFVEYPVKQKQLHLHVLHSFFMVKNWPMPCLVRPCQRVWAGEKSLFSFVVGLDVLDHLVICLAAV